MEWFPNISKEDLNWEKTPKWKNKFSKNSEILKETTWGSGKIKP